MGCIFGLLNNRLFKPHRKADGPIDASAGSEQQQEAAMKFSLRKLPSVTPTGKHTRSAHCEWLRSA